MLYKTKTFKPKGYLTFLLVTTIIPYLATFAVTLKGKRNRCFYYYFLFHHLFHSSIKYSFFILSLYFLDATELPPVKKD